MEFELQFVSKSQGTNEILDFVRNHCIFKSKHHTFVKTCVQTKASLSLQLSKNQSEFYNEGQADVKQGLKAKPFGPIRQSSVSQHSCFPQALRAQFCLLL